MSVQPYPKAPNVMDLTSYDLMSSSPSKLKYSFGGLNNRFQKTRKPCTQAIGYDLPSTKSPRKCSFGVGERFKSLTAIKGRNDQIYNLPTTFKPDNTTSTFCNFMVGKTFSFGAGRSDLKARVFNVSNLEADKSTPGPGTYKPLKPIGTDARKFSLKSKLSYGEPE